MVEFLFITASQTVSICAVHESILGLPLFVMYINGTFTSLFHGNAYDAKLCVGLNTMPNIIGEDLMVLGIR